MRGVWSDFRSPHLGGRPLGIEPTRLQGSFGGNSYRLGRSFDIGKVANVGYPLRRRCSNWGSVEDFLSRSLCSWRAALSCSNTSCNSGESAEATALAHKVRIRSSNRRSIHDPEVRSKLAHSIQLFDTVDAVFLSVIMLVIISIRRLDNDRIEIEAARPNTTQIPAKITLLKKRYERFCQILGSAKN